MRREKEFAFGGFLFFIYWFLPHKGQPPCFAIVLNARNSCKSGNFGRSEAGYQKTYMKNESTPFNPPLPKVGSEYIKLKTGKLVKWDFFDEKTQIFDYVGSNGKVFSVHQRDIETPTSHEEIEHLKNNISNLGTNP